MEEGRGVNGPGVPDKAAVSVVVVTHHPDPGFPSRFEVAARECGGAVVVDNASNATALAMIEREVTRHDAHLIRNPTNRGLAAALNQGAAWAFDRGYAFILVLDQDSEPMPGIVAELRRVHDAARASARTAVVGSNFIDPTTRQPRFRAGETADGWTPMRTVIMSGSLIEREAFREIGPFREEFFVDSVDDDLCFRARANSFQVALTTRPLLRHSIGAPTVHHVAGLRIATSNHSADRRYRMVRNRLVLCREYGSREPKWAVASILSVLSEALAVTLLERDRAAKLRSVAVGVVHGLFGRTGHR